MHSARNSWLPSTVAVLTVAVLVSAGCHSTAVDTSDSEACASYEDSLTGGQIFSMYCSYCHNAPSLAERPYAQFRNIAAHMRVRANLTGKEYAKLLEFLRRWNDIPPPSPPTETTPKRFYFSQPIQELNPQSGNSNPPPSADAPRPSSPSGSGQ